MPDFDKDSLANLAPEQLLLIKMMIAKIEKERDMKEAADTLEILVNTQGVVTGAIQFLQVSSHWNLVTAEKVSILSEHVKRDDPVKFKKTMRTILEKAKEEIGLTRCRIKELEADFDEQVRIYDHLRAQILHTYDNNNPSMFTAWDADINFRVDAASNWRELVNERSYLLQRFVRQNEEEAARMRMEMNAQGILPSQL